MTRYKDARSFRRALEDRLKATATERAIPLDRIRKQVAHERLLARLALIAPPGSWALKGGLALVARLGGKARATKDADATWRREAEAFVELLEDLADCELNDFFEFEIGKPRALDAEGPAGGFRYPVASRVDGRVFERLQLDINVVVDDPRTIETIALPTLLEFAGFEAVQVPMIRIEQHLAEKLHAYCRDYGGRPSGRPKDLFDMLRVADGPLACNAHELRAACRETFTLRETPWPPTLDAPPADWASIWDEYAREYELRWPALDDAYTALRRFWSPVMDESCDGEWQHNGWEWSTDPEPDGPR